MNIYDRKYQVFISSTYKDLIEAREETIRVILSLFQIPIGMEMFNADNEEQWFTIQGTIDKSDYYLIIIGHRYGSLTKEGISFTEKEFDYAKERKIPILAFIRNRDISTKPKERDDDVELKVKLDAFIAKVQLNAMVDFWSDAQELAKQVSVALIKQFHKGDRIGWIRANQAASPEILSELAYLSKENRQLKEELEQIKVKEQNDKPIIKVLMNESKDTLRLYFDKKIKSKIDTLREITKEDYPEEAQNFFSGLLWGNYNRAIIDNRDLVNKYNHDLIKTVRCNSCRRPLEINSINTGSIKAKEIHVNITFPEQIIVLNKENIGIKELPKIPDVIPENPILIASKAAYEQSVRINEVNFLHGNINVDSFFSHPARAQTKLSPRKRFLHKTSTEAEARNATK